jgi:hypothetical protein
MPEANTVLSDYNVIHTYGRCLESRVQCAAVSTWRCPTKEPPHQNSVRREPCRKMAAIHGHRPGRDSSPPTTRNPGTSGWPHSVIQGNVQDFSWVQYALLEFTGMGRLAHYKLTCYKVQILGGQQWCDDLWFWQPLMNWAEFEPATQEAMTSTQGKASETVPTLGATVGRAVELSLDVTTRLGLLVVVVGRLVVVVLTVVASIVTSGMGVTNLCAQHQTETCWSSPWAHMANTSTSSSQLKQLSC